MAIYLGFTLVMSWVSADVFFFTVAYTCVCVYKKWHKLLLSLKLFVHVARPNSEVWILVRWLWTFEGGQFATSHIFTHVIYTLNCTNQYMTWNFWMRLCAMITDWIWILLDDRLWFENGLLLPLCSELSCFCFGLGKRYGDCWSDSINISLHYVPFLWCCSYRYPSRLLGVIMSFPWRWKHRQMHSFSKWWEYIRCKNQ